MSSDKDPMEIESPAYRGDTNKNGLCLFPVCVNSSGKGLPYARENWPKPGDTWDWKVGKRIAASGYFLDRYLYLPQRLRQKRYAFASRLSVEQYIRSEFPSTDINEFFDSFSWRIPTRLLKGGASPHDTGTCASASTDCGESFVSKTCSSRKTTLTFDHRVEILKLDDEVDQILQALKKSQEFEYRLAEETLSAQKNYILNLYEQLDEERSELSSCTSMAETDTLLDVTLKRVEQLKREVLKLKDMKQVQNGFGSTSKQILKGYFGLEAESTESL